MRLKFQKRSELKFVSRIIPIAQHIGILKHSASELVSLTYPRSAAEGANVNDGRVLPWTSLLYIPHAEQFDPYPPCLLLFLPSLQI